jgi:hypothetical protein
VPPCIKTKQGGRGTASNSKKQITNDGPWGGWLVPRRPKKYQGWSDFFVRFFFSAQKRDKKKSRKKSVLDFLSILYSFVQTFRHDFFGKTFFVVLLNSHR